MNLNKYDVSNLFILSFVIIFTIFVFLYELSDNPLDNDYDKFNSIKISKNNDAKYSSDKATSTKEELLEDSYDKLKNVIDDLEEDKPLNIIKEIKISDVKLSYYSPYGKYTPVIDDKIIDINRDVFYIYVAIEDLSLEDSYHKFELYTNFYNPNKEIIESLSQKIGTFEGSNFIFSNKRVISIPVILNNKIEGKYTYNIYVQDLISNKETIYENSFNLLETN